MTAILLAALSVGVLSPVVGVVVVVVGVGAGATVVGAVVVDVVLPASSGRRRSLVA